MKLIVIETNENGGSQISEKKLLLQEGNFTPPSPGGYVTTAPMAAEKCLMMHHPAGYVDEWHTAPAVVLGTILKGTVQIETSDLTTRVLQPGDQFLACDLVGQGHRMSEINGAAFDLALIVLKNRPETSVFL